jgi:hypothetical protein
MSKSPLTTDERNKIYLEIATGLMGVKMENGCSIWEHNVPGVNRFKVMIKLYRDYGKEFSGELEIEGLDRKLIYGLHNDRSKKTTAYLSKDRYHKALKQKAKLTE